MLMFLDAESSVRYRFSRRVAPAQASSGLSIRHRPRRAGIDRGMAVSRDANYGTGRRHYVVDVGSPPDTEFDLFAHVPSRFNIARASSCAACHAADCCLAPIS